MDRRTTYLVLFTLSLTSGIAGLPATTSAAEGPIGVTAVVRNTVSQLEPQVTRIAKGDEVVRNELVRTAADSDARFVLRDDTNLSLGPGSTLRLDRTVFDDPKAGDIAIKLTSGAFRFVTGHSEKEAYEIKTPIATMAVRGTTLDILVQRRRNKIVLAAGKATVCVPGKCVDLIHEGDSVNITASGKGISVDVQNGSDWTFDNVCGSSCGTSTFAEAGGNDINTASLGTGTAVAVVVAVVDRRRQEASLQAEEVAEAEAEVVRLARVRRRAAVLVLAEEASEEVGAARVEVEPLPVVTLAPELPHQLARNLTKSLLGFRCRCGLPCFREFSLAARHDQNLRQPS